MTMDADYVYEGLLRHNYFPMVKKHGDDIPPFFTSEGFSVPVAESLISAQDSLTGPEKKERNKYGFDQIEYRATRHDNILRVMHIPHPTPYARLCQCIFENWESLKDITTNTRSRIRPRRHEDGKFVVMDAYEEWETGRLFVMSNDEAPDEADSHLEMSFGAEYRVKADVAACFPSTYTHAIPWALVGHEMAKENRGLSHWFNRLDCLQRFLKRGETHGIPIGPGTSNLINEIILCRVDQALEDRYSFVRHIDDYTCYCKSRSKAEAFIRDLEAELHKYLHTLNARKLRIEKFPLPFKTEWASKLARHVPSSDELNAQQVLAFLDYASGLQNREPRGSVLKYAARVISRKLTASNVNAFVKYTLQWAYHFPVVLPLICSALERFCVGIKKERLTGLIERHLLYRRSDALCWSLYLLHLSQEELPETLADSIVESGDTMAMAAMLATSSHISRIRSFVASLDESPLNDIDRHWILVYQLLRRNDLPSTKLGDYVEQTSLDVLDDNDVDFLREPDPEEMEREDPE